MSNKRKLSSDLRGVNELLSDAILNVSEIVEAEHKQILFPPFLPKTKIQHLLAGIASTTYRGVRGAARLISSTVDKIISELDPLIGEMEMNGSQAAIYAALNGVIGDYLEEKDNPLAIKMQLRYEGKRLLLDADALKETIPEAKSKVLLMVHGSSMNDLQWHWNGHHHGLALAKEYDLTVVHLYYNTGRHISENGRQFAGLLEELIENWSVPIEEILMLAHSMGGLVSRSAVYYGQESGCSWTYKLKKMIFLGSPHQGASLERIGNYVDTILEHTPYAKPFARIGKIRSAGVTDLRYGSLVDEDWKNVDRFEFRKDKRKIILLPEAVESYAIAATLGKEGQATKWIGDKLVGLKSALGQHNDLEKDLGFKTENCWVAYETDHFELLSSPKVYEKLRSFFVS
jgi:pimeloyl-ACP methyl ester carboxylesterase